MSKNYFVVIYFLGFTSAQTVIAKKLLTSSEQPLAIYLARLFKSCIKLSIGYMYITIQSGLLCFWVDRVTHNLQAGSSICL